MGRKLFDNDTTPQLSIKKAISQGKMLKETELSKGSLRKGNPPQLHDVTTGIKLKDLGLEKHLKDQFKEKVEDRPHATDIDTLAYISNEESWDDALRVNKTTRGEY